MGRKGPDKKMTAIVRTRHDLAAIEPEELIELLQHALVRLQPSPDVLDEAWPNLTMQQLRVMRILYNEGPTRVSVLARRLQVSTPTVTGILDRLVRQGLTYRADDPRDRRVVLNMLTEDGRSVIEQLHPLHADRLRQAIIQMTPEERQTLAEGLQSLLAATKPSDGAPCGGDADAF